MKNDRRHFKKPREPQELGRSYTPDRRWNWRPPLLEGIFTPDQQWKWSLGKPPTGFSESDVGETPGLQCHSESETTWWAEDDHCHDWSLTFEQALSQYKKSYAVGKNECSNKNCTQQPIAFQDTLSLRGRCSSHSSMIGAFQMARSKLSEYDRSKFLHANRLWLDVGETYSNILAYDSPAAINSAGPESSQRIGIWHPESSQYPASLRFRRSWQSVLPISLSASCLAEWNSVMVESVRLVLQRWRGVCSFSQTMRSTRSDEESHLVYDLRSKTMSAYLPDSSLAGRMVMLRSYSKV